MTRPSRSGPLPFSVGDKVQVIVEVERLRMLQQGHGGWNPRMAEVISECFIAFIIEANTCLVVCWQSRFGASRDR